jgi:hypothetical protein
VVSRGAAPVSNSSRRPFVPASSMARAGIIDNEGSPVGINSHQSAVARDVRQESGWRRDFPDVLSRRGHVQRHLAMHGVISTQEAPLEWALAFSDDEDPTQAVLVALGAGWRDPLLVNAAMVICGDRSAAEACMETPGPRVAALDRLSEFIEHRA